MLEVSDGKTFFVENNMEVSIKKGPNPKVTFKFNVNPKIIECNRNEVDFIVNSILQEQNMTLDDFKSELDSKLEKVLTMKYYLTKLYKGGSGSSGPSSPRPPDNTDASSTSSAATTVSTHSTSSDPYTVSPSSSCGLQTTENPDTTFSWKCCCCSFASTGKNLKSTRESYRKHHKNWHSPEGLAQNTAAAAAAAAAANGGEICGPITKKRKPSLGSMPRKSKINNINGVNQGNSGNVLMSNSLSSNGFNGFSLGPSATGYGLSNGLNGLGGLNGLNGNMNGLHNVNAYHSSIPNIHIDDLIVANASTLNMNMNIMDGDPSILGDVGGVNEDDFSSLFDD